MGAAGEICIDSEQLMRREKIIGLTDGLLLCSFFSALTDLANPDNKIAPRVITLSASYHETQPRPFSAAGRWEVFGNCAINQPATFRASEASK